MLRSMSHQSKVALCYICVLFVPLFVVGVLLYSDMIAAQLLRAREQASLEARNSFSALESELTQLEGIAQDTLLNPVFSEYFLSAPSSTSGMILNTTHTITPMITWLKSTNGSRFDVLFFSNNRAIPEGMYHYWQSGVNDKDWYKSVRDSIVGFQPYWEGVHPARAHPFSSPYTGSELSLWMGWKRFRWSESLLMELRMPIHGLLSPLREAHPEGGVVLVDDAGDAVYTSGLTIPMAEVESFLRGGDSEAQLHSGGQTYWVYRYEIGRLNCTAVRVLSGEADTAAFLQARTLFVGLWLAAFVLFSGLSYLLAAVLSRRIRRITFAVRAIEAGDFDCALPADGRDELYQLAGGVNNMAGRIRELINTEYKAAIAHRDAALAALNMQIHPHFIYNVLETLRMKAEVNQQIDLSDALAALGGYMRYNAMNLQRPAELRHELEHVEDYLNIQDMLMDGRVRLSIDVPTDVLDAKMPMLTLQPLAENCVLHGMDRLSERVLHIRISATREGDMARILVEDDGLGMTPERFAETASALSADRSARVEMRAEGARECIGLINVDERLRLSFGDAYGISLWPADGGGVCVEVRVPLE